MGTERERGALDLHRHIEALWRFRRVVAGGLAIGLLLAFAAAYRPGWDGGPTLERRGAESWSSDSRILVTQNGFPWGRVILPSDTPGATPVDKAKLPRDGQSFADPGRFSNLALLYSVVAYSDEVRKLLPEHPRADQIQAIALDATGNRTQFLPVINLTTKAATAKGAVDLNNHTLGGLRTVLQREQRANSIPDKDRVLLSQLEKPSAPQLLKGRSLTPSFLALFTCLLITLIIVRTLNGMRRARSGKTAERPAPRVELFGSDDFQAFPASNGNGNGNGHHPSALDVTLLEYARRALEPEPDFEPELETEPETETETEPEAEPAFEPAPGPRPSGKPLPAVVAVDAVIVAGDGVDRLRDCVTPLAAMDDVSVTVVTRGLRAAGSQALEGLEVDLVRVEPGRGIGVARDLGAAQGNAPHILLLDPDARIGHDDILALMAVLDHDSSVGVVAPQLTDEAGLRTFGLRRQSRRRPALEHALPLRRLWLSAEPTAPQTPAQTPRSMGACVLMRRAVLSGLGGRTDEILATDDYMELCSRIGQAGWNVHYEPRASVQVPAARDLHTVG